jgi:hypothetical protein
MVFNPPMVIPESGIQYPHRDGGTLGIEIPLLFMDFAQDHLKPGGSVLCLSTNPIVNGQGKYFEAMKARKNFELVAQKTLHPYFNQNVARKRKHDEHDVERIELLALHWKKTESA